MEAAREAWEAVEAPAEPREDLVALVKSRSSSRHGLSDCPMTMPSLPVEWDDARGPGGAAVLDAVDGQKVLRAKLLWFDIKGDNSQHVDGQPGHRTALAIAIVGIGVTWRRDAVVLESARSGDGDHLSSVLLGGVRRRERACRSARPRQDKTPQQ
eukprot:7377483-Prymnesium_polylepis.1